MAQVITNSVLQAITTQYLGSTNSRGSRVKATAEAGSVTLPYDQGLDDNENHNRAALALVEKYGWKGNLVAGALPNGRGNVYVFAS